MVDVESTLFQWGMPAEWVAKYDVRFTSEHAGGERLC